MHTSSNNLYPERDQSFWQTGLILGSGLGIVSMVVGGTISKNYGAGVAVTSILLGNFILWFIGLGIISMTDARSHAIQNIKEKLGYFSSIIAAIVFVAAFLVWYALQIKTPAQALAIAVDPKSIFDDTFELRISASLGLLCALISMGGIKTIKWFNISSFPLLIIFLSYILTSSRTFVSFHNSWGISFVGILLIVLTWFPGTVNLSTFFRHSRSRADSVLGLTLMTIVHAGFQFCFVLLDVGNPIDLIDISKNSGDPLYFLSVIFFMVISFVCVNLLNIYWASVGWEIFFKHKQEAKSYAIIGLFGTIIYMFFQYPFFISVIEFIGTSFIAILGVTLITSYMIEIVVQHRIRTTDKLSNSICWFLGCFSSLVFMSRNSNDLVASVTFGINVCLLVFGIIIFIEEILWSIKQQIIKK